MERIRIDETAIGKAIYRYLNDLGYQVRDLEMVHDKAKNEFAAIATVKKD